MNHLPIILGARTFRAAYAAAAEREGRGMTEAEAWAVIRHEIEEAGWAVLLAPHLWAVLEEWWAMNRLHDDLDKARQGRDAVLFGVVGAPLEPDIVEERGKRAAPMGPDALAVRGAALAKLNDSLARMETVLAARRAAFERAVESYHLARLDVARMTLEQRGRALLTHALQARQYDLARELVLLGSEKTEQVDEGFLEMVGSAIKRRFG